MAPGHSRIEDKKGADQLAALLGHKLSQLEPILYVVILVLPYGSSPAGKETNVNQWSSARSCHAEW